MKPEEKLQAIAKHRSAATTRMVEMLKRADEYSEEHAVRTDGGVGGEETYDYEEIRLAYIAGFNDADAHPKKRRIEDLQKENMRLSFQISQMASTIYPEKDPWYSVKERLPETGDDIIYLMIGGTPGRQPHYTKWFEEWLVTNATHWMRARIPQKGGKA